MNRYFWYIIAEAQRTSGIFEISILQAKSIISPTFQFNGAKKMGGIPLQTDDL